MVSQHHGVRVVNEKELERRAPKAPRSGMGSGEGVSPSPVGEGSGWLLTLIYVFMCMISWMILPPCEMSVISHGGSIIHDIIHINTYIRVSSQPVRHTCSLYYGHSRHTDMLPSISIYRYYFHAFYVKKFNSFSLKLLPADGMFIFMNTLVAYGP